MIFMISLSARQREEIDTAGFGLHRAAKSNNSRFEFIRPLPRRWRFFAEKGQKVGGRGEDFTEEVLEMWEKCSNFAAEYYFIYKTRYDIP